MRPRFQAVSPERLPKPFSKPPSPHCHNLKPGRQVLHSVAVVQGQAVFAIPAHLAIGLSTASPGSLDAGLNFVGPQDFCAPTRNVSAQKSLDAPATVLSKILLIAITTSSPSFSGLTMSVITRSAFACINSSIRSSPLHASLTEWPNWLGTRCKTLRAEYHRR